MVDENVPCEDVLSQLNAAKSALHKCGQVVLEGYIKHCVKDGMNTGTRIAAVGFASLAMTGGIWLAKRRVWREAGLVGILLLYSAFPAPQSKPPA